MAYVNVHVDLEDIYDDLSKREKEMLVDWLKDVSRGFHIIEIAILDELNKDKEI